LSRYRYIPDIRLTSRGTLWSYPPWRLPPLSTPYDDRLAVWAIGRLAERGRFSAIHECVGCGKWIFAKRTDSATCGTAACRQRKSRREMSPWQREEARRKARERYQRKGDSK